MFVDFFSCLLKCLLAILGFSHTLLLDVIFGRQCLRMSHVRDPCLFYRLVLAYHVIYGCGPRRCRSKCHRQAFPCSLRASRRCCGYIDVFFFSLPRRYFEYMDSQGVSYSELPVLSFYVIESSIPLIKRPTFSVSLVAG